MKKKKCFVHFWYSQFVSLTESIKMSMNNLLGGFLFNNLIKNTQTHHLYTLKCLLFTLKYRLFTLKYRLFTLKCRLFTLKWRDQAATEWCKLCFLTQLQDFYKKRFQLNQETEYSFFFNWHIIKIRKAIKK